MMRGVDALGRGEVAHKVAGVVSSLRGARVAIGGRHACGQGHGRDWGTTWTARTDGGGTDSAMHSMQWMRSGPETRERPADKPSNRGIKPRSGWETFPSRLCSLKIAPCLPTLHKGGTRDGFLGPSLPGALGARCGFPVSHFSSRSPRYHRPGILRITTPLRDVMHPAPRNEDSRKQLRFRQPVAVGQSKSESWPESKG
jgi:hypothetical protein